MDIFLSIVAIICGLVGLLGVIVPVLPGTLLSYAGLLCVYFTDTSTVTNNQLILWGILSVAVRCFAEENNYCSYYYCCSCYYCFVVLDILVL